MCASFGVVGAEFRDHDWHYVPDQELFMYGCPWQSGDTFEARIDFSTRTLETNNGFGTLTYTHNDEEVGVVHRDMVKPPVKAYVMISYPGSQSVFQLFCDD